MRDKEGHATGPRFAVDPTVPDAAARSVVAASLGAQWSPYDLAFDRAVLSPDDLRCLRAISVPLAFGEATAFDGFGAKIAAAAEGVLKLWLALQLADEARHAVGFARLLDQLLGITTAERWAGWRYTVRFYARITKLTALDDWLFAVLCSEVFGRALYRQLAEHAPSEATRRFFALLRQDESRHVAFLRGHANRAAVAGRPPTLLTDPAARAEIIGICRDMFEMRGLAEVHDATSHFGIDLRACCDRAEAELAAVVAGAGALNSET